MVLMCNSDVTGKSVRNSADTISLRKPIIDSYIVPTPDDNPLTN